MNYRIIRSKRKTIGLEITDEGLLVRAPLRASRREIESVISSHETWIRKKTAQYRQAQASAEINGILGESDIRRLSEQPEVIDSVVVHELCHLLEMNHSKRFYDHVLSVYPDYRKHHAWLTKHGPEIMARAAKV